MRQVYVAPSVNRLNYLGDRYLGVLHTRLRLGHCALNSYLYLINCSDSPSCKCNAYKEDVQHYLLFCPIFSAQRNTLLASVELTAGTVWNTLSSAEKIDFLLNGNRRFSFDENSVIFAAVREFIKQSKRFFSKHLST